MLLLFGSRGGTTTELLQMALRQVYGWQELPPIARAERGKPYFPGCPQVHFNYSHSRELILCALSDAPVGVDLEWVRPRRPGLPRFCLAEEELAWYEGRGSQWEDFYTLWTRREAWCKYSGRGLASLGRRALPRELQFTALSGPGWRGAVCAEERPQGEIKWLTGEAGKND